jgi:hypothetical protein
MVVQGTSEVTVADRELVRLLDVAVGAAGQATAAATSVARGLQALARPVGRMLLRPPLVPHRLQAGTWVEDLAHQGSLTRDELKLRLAAALDVAVPAVVAQGLSRVDLNAIVKQVLDDLDLPELIRESTGSMASESVRGLRMHGIEGDAAIGRAIGRFRLRRTPSP